MADIDVLVQRWQAGDEKAAEALYNRYRERTFHLALGLLGDPADAEETAQEALTYALLNIKRYDPRRAGFATWLHTITVSRCRDRQRRRRLITLPFDTLPVRGSDLADPSPGPEHRAMQSEKRSQVWEAVQDLSPALREAIVLRYWAGHTFQEIAVILGCPLRTAQSRVRLAFQKLQGVLAQEQLNGLKEEQV
jgi:RNA polymerase sigma-70 factor (ECF subfamily)